MRSIGGELVLFLAVFRSVLTMTYYNNQVPLDYDDPEGRSAAIAVIRKPALVPPSDPTYRGPVLFNPGGPGGSGVDFILATADSYAQILGPQFDIVSFDPRGSNHPVSSTVPLLITCAATYRYRAVYAPCESLRRQCGAGGVLHTPCYRGSHVWRRSGKIVGCWKDSRQVGRGRG